MSLGDDRQILRHAEQLAPRYLAQVGLSRDVEGTMFWAAVNQLANAKQEPSIERLQDLLGLFDALAREHPDVAAVAGINAKDSASDLGADIGARLAVAAFYLGLSVAAVFYGGAR